MKTRYRAEWLLLKAALVVFGGIRGISRAVVARSLGVFTFSVLGVRRAVTLSNLRLAFGGSMTAAQLRQLGTQCYVQLGESALEMAELARSTKREAASCCEIEQEHILKQSLSSGRGVVLVTGHLGNWELLAASLSSRGFPMTAVAARIKNPLVNRWVTDLRIRFGIDLVQTGRSAGRGSLKALKAGRVLMLLIDQDARDKGIFVHFFGRLASTPSGAATLAQRSGSPIVPCRIRRGQDGMNRIVMHTALDPPERSGGEAAVHAMMQELTTLLESWIREEPGAWFWPHRRFKTRAPGSGDSSSIYARG